MNYLLYYATNQKKFKICGDIMRLRFEFSIRHRTLNLFTSTFADAATPVSRFLFLKQITLVGGIPFSVTLPKTAGWRRKSFTKSAKKDWNAKPL